MSGEFHMSVARTIDAERERLAQAMTQRQYEAMPELAHRYGPVGREKCLQDARFHLSYLAEAVAAELPSLFADYVGWAKIMLAGRGIPAEDLAVNIGCLRDALEQTLPREAARVAREYVEEGLSRLPQLPADLPPFIKESEPLAGLARQYLDSLLRGERHVASRLILDAVDRGTGVKDLYLHVFQRSQYEIGRLWQVNRITVAQEHYCTAATQLIMSQLYPYIFAGEKNGRTLVATCVGGDLHEIGVRMVSDFFEMEGWDTFYLGANTPAPSIIQTVIERKADVLAISATMAFHARAIASVIGQIRANEAARGVKVLVGGYPFNATSDLWQKVGADGCAGDAEQAILVANRLLESDVAR